MDEKTRPLIVTQRLHHIRPRRRRGWGVRGGASSPPYPRPQLSNTGTMTTAEPAPPPAITCLGRRGKRRPSHASCLSSLPPSLTLLVQSLSDVCCTSRRRNDSTRYFELIFMKKKKNVAWWYFNVANKAIVFCFVFFSLLQTSERGTINILRTNIWKKRKQSKRNRIVFQRNGYCFFVLFLRFARFWGGSHWTRKETQEKTT